MHPRLRREENARGPEEKGEKTGRGETLQNHRIANLIRSEILKKVGR